MLTRVTITDAVWKPEKCGMAETLRFDLPMRRIKGFIRLWPRKGLWYVQCVLSEQRLYVSHRQLPLEEAKRLGLKKMAEHLGPITAELRDVETALKNLPGKVGTGEDKKCSTV